MPTPPGFTPYDWHDFASGGTAIQAAVLKARELALASYAYGLVTGVFQSDTAANPGDALTPALGTTAVDVFGLNSVRIAAGFTNYHLSAIVWVKRGGTAVAGQGEPVFPMQEWTTTTYKGRVSIISDTASTPIPRWEV